MALRFSKRIKIAPGIRVNLSKSGVSTTLGPRGASINVGKKGVHSNLGIPGTGLSTRTKIAGGTSQAKAPRAVDSAPDKQGGGFTLLLIVALGFGLLIWAL